MKILSVCVCQPFYRISGKVPSSSLISYPHWTAGCHRDIGGAKPLAQTDGIIVDITMTIILIMTTIIMFYFDWHPTLTVQSERQTTKKKMTTEEQEKKRKLPGTTSSIRHTQKKHFFGYPSKKNMLVVLPLTSSTLGNGRDTWYDRCINVYHFAAILFCE